MHDTTVDLSQSPVDSEYQSQSSLQDSTNDTTSTASFFDTQQVNGMTSFMANNGTTLNANDLKTVPLLQQQTSITGLLLLFVFATNKLLKGAMT